MQARASPDPTVGRTTLNGYAFLVDQNRLALAAFAMVWSDTGLAAPCSAPMSTNE